MGSAFVSSGKKIATLVTYISEYHINLNIIKIIAVFVLMHFMAGDQAWAATGDAEAQAITTITTLLDAFVSVGLMLMTPLIMLAGWLLSPDWTL